jgi:cobaltochelatase CobT
MKQFSIERSLHILGPVLGKKRGVDVRIGGGQACTDGKTIWLPALPLDDAEAAALGFGLLFHETNHVRYTDFAVVRGDGLVGALTNALEDIRIDGLGHQEYPGGRSEEEHLVAALVRRGEAKSCTKDDHPARILESYVMWRLEFDVLGIDAAQDMAGAAEALFRQTFPAGVQTKLDALMFGIRNCNSTGDVQALARSIAQMLEDEARTENVPNANGQPVQREPRRNAPSPLRQALDAAAEDHASGIGELAQAAIDAKSQELPILNLPMPRGAVSGVPLASAEVAAFATEVKAASNALRQRLAGLLQAETLCRRYRAVTGKRIDSRRLCRFEAGDGRIFVRDVKGLRTDTAVQILVDRSGSMGSSRVKGKSGGQRPIEVARAACFATALALQQTTGVTVAVAAFPGGGDHDVMVMAPFAERVDRYAARFASLEAKGGTPMAEAMLWGAGELLAQPRPRRILLICTDGVYDDQLGQAMVARLERVGIEALGIGIHCDVAHLFARSRRIFVIGDLTAAMFELLLEAIQRPVAAQQVASRKH